MASMNKIHVNLIFDFDGTLTTADTTSILGQVGVDFQHKHGRHLDLHWSQFTDAYLADLAAHGPSRDIEEASFDRVVAAGVYEGMAKQDIVEGARNAVNRGNVCMREGWPDLVKFLATNTSTTTEFDVEVLSVNWSATWIRAVLHAAAERASVPDKIVERWTVTANELLMEEHKRSHAPAQLPKTIRDGSDKLDYLYHLVLNVSAPAPVPGIAPPEILNVYIGDSSTDFDCLLTADIGIIIGEQAISQQEGLQAEDVDPASLNLGDLVRFVAKLPVVFIGEFDPKAEVKKIYWANDLGDIVEWLKRLQSDVEHSEC